MTSPERNLALTLAYDGTAYAGFQRQANAVTIQALLEEALGGLAGEAVVVHAAGRTDAGVHARGQVVSFRTRWPIPADRVPHACAGALPQDIVVLRCLEVPVDFHARYRATGKTYSYLLDNRPFPSPFLARYAWHVPDPLDAGAMAAAAAPLIGKHDFSSFRAAGGAPGHAVRELTRAEVRPKDGLLVCIFSADGFLYHMVRNIVGLLVEAGRNKFTPADVTELLRSRDRTAAPATAPARGLCLEAVDYGPFLDTHGAVY